MVANFTDRDDYSCLVKKDSDFQELGRVDVRRAICYSPATPTPKARGRRR
jgi:hypothetical protein